MDSALVSRLTQPDQKLMKSKEIEKKKKKLRVTLATGTGMEEVEKPRRWLLMKKVFLQTTGADGRRIKNLLSLGQTH